MSRENTDYNKELQALINQYKAMKSAGNPLYLDADQLADIADYYISNEQMEEAEEVIDYGLNLHPGNTDLLIEKAYFYLDVQQTERAQQIANSIADDYDPEVTLLKAEILIDLNHKEEADELINTIHTDDNVNPYIGICNLYVDTDQAQKALPWIKKAREMFDDTEDLLESCTHCYSACGMYKEAEETYNLLIDIDPFSSAYWTGLAKIHFLQQAYAKALEAADFAITADENYGEAHLTKAHCLFHLNQTKGVREEYEKAIKLKAVPPEVGHLFIGLWYNERKKFKEAYNAFERGLKAEKRCAPPLPDMLVEFYSNQAFSLMNMDRLDEAEALCKQCKLMAPNNNEAYYIQGRIYLIKGEEKRAIKEWKAAFDNDPVAETWFEVGNIHMALFFFEEARTYYRKAWKLNPELLLLNEQLAKVYLLTGDDKNFRKFNRLSKRPISPEEMDHALSLLNVKNLLELDDEFFDEDDDDDEYE